MKVSVEEMVFLKRFTLILLLIATCVTAKTSSRKHAPKKTLVDNQATGEHRNVNITEPYSSGFVVDNEKESSFYDEEETESVMSESDKKKLIEVLSNEGKPGWFEKAKKVGSQVAEQAPGKNRDKSNDLPKEALKDAPTEMINNLKTKLSTVSDPLATNVKNSLNKLNTKWSNLKNDDRKDIMGTLTTITKSFDKFVKAGDNPIGAVQGAIDIIGAIASNFGPKGQLLSMGLGFVSSILGLFGKAPKQPSMSEIVRKVIKKALSEYRDETLTDKANGVIRALSASKAYLDGVAEEGEPLNLEQMKLASSRVPIIQGSEFMGELFVVTRNLFDKNSAADAMKAIKYTELYTKMATIRDMILTQFISITSPDKNLKFDVRGLINTRKTLRGGVRVLLEKLYVIDFSNKILPYFDPDNSPATDSYAQSILNMGKYDRSMAGEYCLVYTDGRDLDWQREYSQYKLGGKPYVVTTSTNNANCYWKLVPHGNYIYSIVNKYKCKDKYDYCNAMLSWDSDGDNAWVNIDSSDPVLWEIWGYNYRRIQSKWGCDTGHKFCNRELRYEKRKLPFGKCLISSKCNLKVGQLRKSDGKYYWRLRKRT